MRIIVTGTPVAGHLNPLLLIGRILVEAGHEVLGLSADVFRARFTAIGAGFRVMPGLGGRDLSDVDAAFPERETLAPGSEQLRYDMDNGFIQPIPDQHAGLEAALRDFPADVVVADS